MSALQALTAPQTPMNKLEAAFAGYLNALAQQPGALSPIYRVTFFASTSTAKKTLPACIVWCEEAREIKVNSGVYFGRWFVYPWTQRDDDNNPAPAAALGAVKPPPAVAPEVVHDGRLAAIQEGLRDAAPVMAALNYSPSKTPRPVQSFHLFGYHEAEDKHADRQRAFGEALCYEGGFANYSVKD